MINYKLCAIASVLAFTAEVPSTFASAQKAKIYPNEGCLRVIRDDGRTCALTAKVEGEAMMIDWFAYVRKKDKAGDCSKANLTMVRPRYVEVLSWRGDARFESGRAAGWRRDSPIYWPLCR